MSGIRVLVAGASIAGPALAHWLCRLQRAVGTVAGPDARPGPDFSGEWFTDLIERALNGAELPDYAGLHTKPEPWSGPVPGTGGR